jgi:phospholipid/cholesterol/gamma-HCH transport system substrate-binding protein
MLLERNQVLIGLIAAVLIGVGTLFAVFATGGAFVKGFPVSAEFTDAAGLGPGDFVFVAGVRSGQVTGVHIEGDRVVADFTLTSEGIPADSTVSIILQSTLGRRALSVDPGTSTEYFQPGDVIALDRTSTPVDLPELGDRGSELLGEVDIVAMQGIIDALGDITEDSREDVVALLDGLQKVSQIVVDRRVDLEKVIAQAQTLVDAAADQDREIIRVIDAFGSTLDTLVQKRPEITRLLEETGDTSTMTAELVSERRAQIDQILAELNEDLAIVDAHQVDLAHIFAVAGVAFEGFASIGYGAGPAKIDTPHWGNVFTTGLGKVGVQALIGCGSPVDAALSAILGPDPNCDGFDDVNPPTRGRTDAPASVPMVEGAGGFFTPAMVASRLEPVAAPSDLVLATTRKVLP